MGIRRRLQTDPELDITSFMSLMTVLVPVLLLNMVFSHISVLNLNLPGLSDASAPQQENRQLELVLRTSHIDINYPAGVRVKRVEHRDGKPDFKLVSDVLQEVKRSLREKDIDKQDLVILSEPGTPYRTLVGAMDTARSFRAVVAASVVDAELFPQISLGDAPLAAQAPAAGADSRQPARAR